MRKVVCLAALASLFALVVSGAVLPAAWAQSAPSQFKTDVTKPLAGVRTWGYQLQKTDPDVVAASSFDLVVVDYSRSGGDEGRFSADEVRAMQKKPDGSRRIVLAYLSIGEAESYRYYWGDNWVEPIRVFDMEDSASTPSGRGTLRVEPGTREIPTRALHVPKLTAPTWLGRENPDWGANFLVRYWDANWQKIIFGSPNAYLDRILASGFDGVYLDRVDAFYAVADDRPQAKQDMVRFVAGIARHARKLKPGFLVVPQNGEELLLEPAYLATIDGIAKEDLLTGSGESGRRNSSRAIANSEKWLRAAQQAGLPVYVVEYVQNAAKIESLREELVEKGFVPYFGVRTLDRLVERQSSASPQSSGSSGSTASSPRASAGAHRR